MLPRRASVLRNATPRVPLDRSGGSFETTVKRSDTYVTVVRPIIFVKLCRSAVCPKSVVLPKAVRTRSSSPVMQRGDGAVALFGYFGLAANNTVSIGWPRPRAGMQAAIVNDWRNLSTTPPLVMSPSPLTAFAEVHERVKSSGLSPARTVLDRAGGSGCRASDFRDADGPSATAST
eukprot:GHVU01219773.1.p4 GENE.GHVU01219773.1~~GHVU01219773.1.p4  ORF type:complete len:176 (+),score=5.15 GHVU01219773.1:973-1500(+)